MQEVIGYFTHKETTVMQHNSAGDAFKQLFLQTQPARILEIGTAYGGLTLLLRDMLDQAGLYETGILTYDNNPDYGRHWLLDSISKGANINFQLKNVFNHMYDNLLNESEPVEFIQQVGTTIVLCDGGSKKNEFNILAKYLKRGDIIMAHDYAPNAEYFENNIRNKIWNWMEIQDSDIENISIEYDLEPFLQEVFQKVVWVCKIKK